MESNQKFETQGKNRSIGTLLIVNGSVTQEKRKNRALERSPEAHIGHVQAQSDNSIEQKLNAGRPEETREQQNNPTTQEQPAQKGETRRIHSADVDAETVPKPSPYIDAKSLFSWLSNT